MTKPTMAQKHVRKSFARIAKKNERRLANRPMPYITDENMRSAASSSNTTGENVMIVATSNGELYRLNISQGTIRHVRWEQ